MKHLVKFEDYNKILIKENLSVNDISDIKSFVEKNSFFNFDMIDDFDVLFSSRKHGSVGNETHGREDYVEGVRLKKLLLNEFSDISAIVEVVDEFVIVRVTLSEKEKSHKESQNYYQKLVDLTDGDSKLVDAFINTIKYVVINDRGQWGPKEFINHFSNKPHFQKYRLEDYKEKMINIIVAYRIGLLSEYDFNHADTSPSYHAIIELNKTVLDIIKDDIELCDTYLYHDYEYTDEYHAMIKFGNSKMDDEKSYTYFTTDENADYTSEELLHKTLSDIKEMTSDITSAYAMDKVKVYYNDFLDMLDRNK